MKISDAYGDIYGSSGNGSYGDLGYDARQRRLDEEHETDEYRAWVARVRNEPRNYTGPYCFRCSAKVDYRETGDAMRPIEVYDRDTNVKHRWRCFDRKLRKR